MKIDSTNAVLEKYAPANLNWRVVKYPGESHSSIRLKTTYDGLRFSYGWCSSSIEFHPMNGMVAPDKPVNIWYFTDTAGVRYTIDGTDPTPGSLPAQQEITLNQPAKLAFRQFTNRPLYDKIKTGEFTPAFMPAPIKKPKNAEPGGFSYAYYEGDWTTFKDLNKLKPPANRSYER